MTITIDSRISGFRKWAEARQPKTSDRVPAGHDRGGGIAAAPVAGSVIPQDQATHRPWLVPGVGKL